MVYIHRRGPLLLPALGEKLLLKQRTAKRTCKGICHPRVDARVSSDPGWCRQVGVELQNFTDHHVLCSCSENETISDDGRSVKCCSLRTSIHRDRHPELFDSIVPALSAQSSDKTIENIRKDILKALKDADQGGSAYDQRLVDIAALLHKRKIPLLKLGNRVQFRVCSN